MLEYIDFSRKVGQSKIPDIKLRQLISHFSIYRLRNEDLEFPDLLGAAYEYLIESPGAIQWLRTEFGQAINLRAFVSYPWPPVV